MKKFLSALIVLSFQISATSPFLHLFGMDIFGWSLPSAIHKQDSDDSETGLKFRLSSGSAEKPPVHERTEGVTQDLSESEVRELLGRVPPDKDEAVQSTDLKLAPGARPAPKTGDRGDIQFPRIGEGLPQPTGDTAELEIVRFAPEGEIGATSELFITFSQPMVPIGSQQEAASFVPMRITPELPGSFRWLGTRTLVFKPNGGFPLASEFKIQVGKEVVGLSGSALGKDFSWSFRTKAPSVSAFSPSGTSNSRSPMMVVEFDQPVEMNRLIGLIKVAANGKRFPVRFASKEEIGRDEMLEARIRNRGANRIAVFRLDESVGTGLLPADSKIMVTISEGVSGISGPRRSSRDFSYEFQTHGPLKLEGVQCGWRSECLPDSPLTVSFSNSLDAESFSEEWIAADPPIKDMKVSVFGRTISIGGIKKPRATLKLKLDRRIRDVFGQELGTDETIDLKVEGRSSDVFFDTGTLVTLDPFQKTPIYSFHSINVESLRVRMRSVAPNDWVAYQNFLRNRFNREEKNIGLPGTIVFDRDVKPKALSDEIVRTDLNLSPALKKGTGHLILEIERPTGRNAWPLLAWIQVTKLGLDAFEDDEELVAYVSDLRNGRPIKGAKVSLRGEPQNTQTADQGAQDSGVFSLWNWAIGIGSSFLSLLSTREFAKVTDESGLARIELTGQPKVSERFLLAESGQDFVIVPLQRNYDWIDFDSFGFGNDRTDLSWFVFDDRSMYRPGEEVSVKGYVRSVGMGKGGDVRQAVGLETVNFSVTDSRGIQVTKGEARFNAFGAFDFNFKLPENLNLGRAVISLGREPDKSEHSLVFQVQEFRRPEFEVESKVVSEAPHIVGGSARVMASAKYFAGGGLVDSPVTWSVESTQTRYTPPNRGEYSFGIWTPWWRVGAGTGNGSRQIFSGTTDSEGNDFLRIDFDSASPAVPHNLKISSSVSDVNRQTFSASTSLLVHPSDVYVGLKSERTFVEKGTAFKIKSIATDIEGNLVAGRQISMTATLRDWVFKGGKWSREVIDEQQCTVISVSDSVECAFSAKAGGQYEIVAIVEDEKGQPNESQLTVWVSGGKSAPAGEDVEEEEVELVPSKSDYAPGEVAEILVNSPFTAAEGILTTRRGGILKTERFTITDNSAVLKVPIEEAHIPNLFASVRLVGVTSRGDGNSPRPATAKGVIELRVSRDSRKLTVKATPESDSMVPGGRAKISVSVKDSAGIPVKGSEIAILVVDESVLSLTGYAIGDPLSVFYPSRTEGTRDHSSRTDIRLGAEVGEASEGMENLSRFLADGMPPQPAPMAVNMLRMMEAGERQSSEIKARIDFNPLALFLPSVITDENGNAVTEFTLPDNLTRYRITAIAVDSAKQFGKGESSLTARQPLMVRPSPPRFANFGDRFELPVVVQNQTDSDMTVNVAVRASNLKLTETGGKRVTIPANNRVEIRFPVETVSSGVSRIQFAASSNGYSDAAELSIPVYTPATTEAFATYGSLDSARALFQPISVPSEVFSEYGGLEVSLSSTQLQELTDAFIYLYRYPFECTEQVASRMISVAALRDVLREFKSSEIPTQAELEASFERDIEILLKRQRIDGSFGLWTLSKERYEYPFVTVHAAHALAIARDKGYKVPQEAISRVLSYLRGIEAKLDSSHSSNQFVRLTLSAYALHVRALLGEPDAKKARMIASQTDIEAIPLEALGWLLGVMAADGDSKNESSAVKRYLMNRVTETASTANFTTGVSDGGYMVFHSNRRTDGVLLDALLRTDPKNEIIPKLVRGLLAQRRKGAWSSTQENVFILLAMDRYFKEYEGVTPNFVARLWLGDTYGGEVGFTGRSSKTESLEISMRELIARGRSNNLVLQRDGKGRMYYRIGVRYAPLSLVQESADFGFEVTRTYEGADDPKDVVRNPDGTWSVKSGARIRVKLQMSNSSRRYHVALVDRLPAGFEILNPGLATTEALPGSTGDTGNWWRRFWYEHQNLRDERAEAFASILFGGVYEFSYVVRATTPGRFVAPAAKAEEMYAPETFGRSASDVIVIK
jgi:alpha-2-macroglobulin